MPVRLSAAISSGTAEDNPPSWGLDRIDQRKLPLDKEYAYPKSAGDGVNVYVVDTGINVNHEDIKGRATWGAVFGAGKNDPQVDDIGHGTFVAGVIAGKRFGVAKKAKVISVKVYRKKGDQTTSDVVNGLKWVLQQHQSSSNKKTIVNMSSGAPYDQVLNNAVEQLTAAGITVVTSAGNSGEQNVPFDSCNHSPSSAASVISVGATDKDDKVASYSNTGRCVTLFAPGTDVVSISNDLNIKTTTNGGTSFSTPYVTGVAALLLGEKGAMSPADVKKALVNAATKNVIKGFKSGDSAPNLMLYSRVFNFNVDSHDKSSNNVKGASSSAATTTGLRMVKLPGLSIMLTTGTLATATLAIWFTMTDTLFV
ncbi:peptidase S8/S53 domain-containing protein [Syncephalis plumigaleata]|nr:peptidase S8/S53 domain-containing protein [Syncephalis plumigaleata]